MEIKFNNTLLGVKIEDLIISTTRGNVDAQGILRGAVIVNDSAKFTLHGIMHGDLLVNEGGTAEIYGTLDAPAIQSHGQLDIYGSVTCPLGVPETAILHSGCVVNGEKHD